MRWTNADENNENQAESQFISNAAEIQFEKLLKAHKEKFVQKKLTVLFNETFDVTI